VLMNVCKSSSLAVENNESPSRLVVVSSHGNSSSSSGSSSSPGQPALAGWYTATAIPLLVVCQLLTDMKPGGVIGSSSSIGSQQSRPQGSSSSSGGAICCTRYLRGGRVVLPCCIGLCFVTGTPPAPGAYRGLGRRTVRLCAPTQRIGTRKS